MRKRPLGFTCLIFLLILSCSFVVTSGKSPQEIPASSIFYDGEEENILVEGQVYKKTCNSNYQILFLKNNSVYDSNLLIYDEYFTDVAIGQFITLKGKIVQFEKARNPGNFDQALYYARQEIYGAIWCEEVLQISGDEHVIMENLYRFKIKWKEKLIECLGEESGGILSAMLLGEKNAMNPDTKELYQLNGIGHILAISGLHISFVGLGIYHILRRIGFSYGVAGIGVFLVLWGYVLMIGWTVSVIRAFIMLLFRIGANVFGRVYDVVTALLVAATITILYNPFYLTDAGFYLSYGAIFAILFIVPCLQKSFPSKKKALSGLYASLAIQIMLLPVLLWFYYEVPVYSVLLNMIIIPLTGIVLGCGIIGSGMLCVVHPFGVGILKICHIIFETFRWLGERVIHFPGARWIPGKPSIYTVVLYYILLLCIVLCIRKRKKGMKMQWTMIVFATFFLTLHLNEPLTITMLDVGQGDGIFIRGPKKMTYFIDGGSSDVNQLGKYRIETFLKYHGMGKIDYVFITHGDEDHCSGIREMIARKEMGIGIKNLVLPMHFQQDETLQMLVKEARNAGVKVFAMEAGDILTEQDLKITCIQPGKSDKELCGNAGSLVVELEFKNFSMLFTGDVEEEGEERLCSKLKGKSYDVLKVSHHGSKNSSTEQFLKIVKPKYALISAGKDNSYGHPHNETLIRLQNIGCKVYQTTENGAITITTDGNSLTIE